MRSPSFDELASEIEENGTKPGGFSYATNMHKNPYFYKYYWWVFWKGSPTEGSKFLQQKYRLCTHDAFTLIEQLRTSGDSYMIYNGHTPRYDLINTPFDFNNLRWKNCIFAPSYEMDTDPVWISRDGVIFK